MPRGAHLHGFEAHLTDHLTKSLSMVPPGPEPQHAEEMTDPVPWRRPEVHRHQAPCRLEHAMDLGESSTFQLWSCPGSVDGDRLSRISFCTTMRSSVAAARTSRVCRQAPGRAP
jgi:hypothetical protein